MAELPGGIHIELELKNSSIEGIVFRSPDELKQWAEMQLEELAKISPSSFSHGDIWSAHTGNLRRVVAAAEELRSARSNLHEIAEANNWASRIDASLSDVRRAIEPYRLGALITTYHRNFQLAASLAEQGDHRAAGSVLHMSIEGGSRESDGNRFEIIERAMRALLSLQSASLKSDQPVSQWHKELSNLHRDFSAKKGQLEDGVVAQAKLIKEQSSTGTLEMESQIERWTTHIAETKEEWKGMKAVYDEQLALLAPTEYWANRSKNHLRTSIIFASSFGVAVSASLIAFFGYAIPYLTRIQDAVEPATLVSALPVLIPSFAIVWVLRILARQLSENLTLMQDARERETMVKTFLAFMRDQVSGKAVVTDQDRAVILHSLFRPSTVTATDDSPPLSVLERISGKK